MAAIGTITKALTPYLIVTSWNQDIREYSLFEYVPDYSTGISEVDRLSKIGNSTLHDLDQRQCVYVMAPSGNPLEHNNPVCEPENYLRFELCKIMSEVLETMSPVDILTACQTVSVFPRDSGQNGMTAYNLYYSLTD